MSSEAFYWLAFLVWLMACLLAIAARALRQFSRHDLQEQCNKRGRLQRFSEVLRHHESAALSAEILELLATAGFIALLCSGFVQSTVHDDPLGAAHIVWAIVGAGLAIVAGQVWLPAAFVQLWAESFLATSWPVWRGASHLLAPLVKAVALVSMIMRRLSGRKPVSTSEEALENEIRTIVTEGHREGLLEEDAREMIEGVMELGEVLVSEIMTPRTDMISISLGWSWDEILKFVIDVGHTRIPVYNKSRDDVVGLLHIKDLLPELAKKPGDPRRPLAELLRKPYFVPETKRVNDLLQEFQRTRSHIAVVLDEYGGVSGLVTIEDALEEIVGEIADEYDDDLVEGIKTLDARHYQASARVRIHEINERIGLELPEDADFDTIGGFVFHELGRIPTVGEEITWRDVRIRVLDATRRRIDRVAIEVVDSSQQPAQGT